MRHSLKREKAQQTRRLARLETFDLIMFLVSGQDLNLRPSGYESCTLMGAIWEREILHHMS